jgi:hypothetical protein
MPGTIGTAETRRVTSSLAFGGAGGMASYMRTVKAPITQLTPTPAVPSPPSGGGGRGGRGGRDPIVIRFESTGDKLIDAMFNQLRSRIRVQGGNVQVGLGQ